MSSITEKKVKTKIQLVVLLAIVSLFILLVFVIPGYNGKGVKSFNKNKTLKDLILEYNENKLALEEGDDAILTIAKVNNSYDAYVKNPLQSDISTILPDKADYILILYEFFETAKKLDIQVENPSFSDDSSSNTNNVNTLTINFSIEGSYQNLKDFLYKLQLSKRIYNVTNLSFSSSDTLENKNNLKFSVSVETYYLK